MSKISVNDAFCKLLIHNKLIDEQQAQQNLEIASRLKEFGINIPFSDLLVERGVLAEQAAGAVRKLVEKKINAPLPELPVRGLGPTPAEDRKFGKLLVHNGLVDEETLDQALQTQAQMREEDGVKLHLGEILVGRGAVHLEVLESVLELQRAVQKAKKRPSRDDLAALPTQHQDLQFAQLAIDERRVSPEQVQDALRFQRELHQELGFSQRLGAILLAQEVMTEEAVRSILETQADYSREGDEELELFLLPPGATEERLGQILEKHDLVPPGAVEQCLELKAQLEQLGLKRSLGEVLLMRGYIDPDQLQPLLKVQRETNRVSRRQVESKLRDRARKRRKEQEAEGSVPPRLPSARRGKASGSRSSAAVDSPRSGRSPALIGGVLLFVVLLAAGGFYAFSGRGKPSRPVEQGKDGTGQNKQQAKPVDPEHEKLKRELQATREEMELSPRLAAQVVEELAGRAKKRGWKDLIAQANELGRLAQKAIAEYDATEFEERVQEIDDLLKKKRVLDARQVLASVTRYFQEKTEHLSPRIKGGLAQVTQRVETAEKQAIAALVARLDQALGAYDWPTVDRSIRLLDGFRGAGEKLAKQYEARLKQRKREYIAERVARIRAERRKVGQTRLEKARGELARRRAELRRGLERRSSLARERTASRPIAIGLRGGETLRECRIEQVTETGIVVAGKLRGKPFTGRLLLWTRLQPRFQPRVVPLTLADDDARAFLELGKYCIKHDLFDEAERLIGRAVQVDSSLKGKVPVVAEYRKPTNFASGKITRRGEQTTITYAFDSAEELEDFSSSGKSVKVEGGELKFAPRRLVFPSAYAVRPTIEMIFQPGKAPPGGYLMLHVSYIAGAAYKGVWIVLNDKYDSYAAGEDASYFTPMLKMMMETLKLKPCKRDQPIRFLLDAKRIGILIGDDSVFSRPAKNASNVQFKLMGYSRNPEAMFGMQEIRVSGNVPDEKYKRVIEEKRAWKLRQMDQQAGEESESETDMPRIGPEYSEQLTPSESLPYREMISAIETYLKQPDYSGRAMIVEAMERFEKETKNCAGFYFYRGWFRDLRGEYQKALEDLDRAVQLEPGFHEALARKADVLSTLDRDREAMAACRQSLQMQPDYSYAHLLLARLRFYKRKSAEEGHAAIREMEVAAILAPRSKEIRETTAKLEAVLKGPPWPRGRPTPIESKQYQMMTDLPAKEAKVLLDELERIHVEYRKFLPPREVQIPRGFGYVFATEATYLIYRELTLGVKPAHNTLGYYHSGYRQLHLFKDQEDTGTRKVAMTLDTLRHEAWHMYVDNIVPAIPRWLNEGLAEYFGAAVFEEGKPTRFGIQKMRLASLLEYLKQEPPMPTKTLMNLNGREFMSYDLGYSHAWSLVYMCLVHHPEKYRKLFIDYLEALRKGRSNSEALEAQFSDADFAQMDTDFKAMLAVLAKQQKNE